ncbi:MAG TPA: hypothetical protein ENJ65_05235 [Candidatus Tenderia electrophaga]|uniref:Secreted protein n=1 Tax=Candidatus Tenderia electrophaga TaxID=1748243 RepID=A0A832J7L9_9GAMM|nr:hypothetical protein [Candidatus Tenderia electrophaga]
MHKANFLLLSLCLVSTNIVADEAEESGAPDLEFLEFLGEWQDDGEAWLDTQKLEELAVKPTPATEVEDE